MYIVFELSHIGFLFSPFFNFFLCAPINVKPEGEGEGAGVGHRVGILT